jgi:hypothetical protein
MNQIRMEQVVLVTGEAHYAPVSHLSSMDADVYLFPKRIQ